MCYSALEHLLCLAAQNSWESSRPSRWIIEQGTVLRNISHLTKTRNCIECYRFCEKANRVYGVIQLLSTSWRHIIHAKAMYSSNNAGVVGNRVILGTLKARKQNYSGAKWRLSCNVCWHLIHWKVLPWHRNVSTFEECEILNGIKCPQSL